MIENSLYNIFPGKLIGGKASSLVKMKDAGFNVPTFKIIPAEYYNTLLENKAEEHSINDFFNSFEFNSKDKNTILTSLPDNFIHFSVRSSAMGEDGKNYSFAGQFETFLYVSKVDLFDKIIEVWRSAFSERINFYKKQNQIEGDVQMAVVIQAMVNSDTSGVMFGINPVSQIEGEMLISSVYGLGEGLVSGELNADNFYLKDGQIIEREIVNKDKKLCYASVENDVSWSIIEDERKEIASLSDHQVHELYKQLDKLNTFYKSPQDVEWAYQNNELFILQSRPITNLQIKSSTRIVWDNSNIIESYPGVTTPLTFSFIRDMYEAVYMQFSALLGVPKKTIKENKDVFENMLGLLRGRVYYNLLGWYKALALLPGYHLNAEFMEGMMGVKERFELQTKESPKKSKARIQLIKTIWKMIVSLFKLPKETIKFQAFLDSTIASYKEKEFEKMHPEVLMENYKEFEQILLEKWEPPLVNDFFAMIFFGIFQKLVSKWIDSENLHLSNDLLAHSDDIVSVLPMKKSLEIAKLISENIATKNLFLNNPPEVVWESMKNKNDDLIANKINEFIDAFGERCLGELKLETISYTQAPEKYIKILQSYVKNPESLESLGSNKSSELRAQAYTTVKEKLRRKPFKKMLFNYVMKKTRALVSNRENLRFERTRGFGIVRSIFSAMGTQFEERGFIENDRDIFYLTKEEIFDFIKGTSISQNIKSTIKQRKLEYGTYENDIFVPERITTFGTVYDQIDFTEPVESIQDGDIKGIACCAGIVTAEVCVIHSPDEVDNLGGRIMVTSSTDPGWVSLFPTASAILVERGSLLSHSAIVARELGIPCIVGITGLLSKLKTGDVVEMDGSTGFVKIINHEE